MKLYFAPRTRAIRPRWLLEELGVPYELVRLDLSAQQNRTQEYLELNPLGELPALVDGEVTLFESSAMILYLADRFPAKQLSPPPDSPARAQFLQWLLFAEQRLEPVLLEHYHRAQVSQAPIGVESRLDELLAIIDTRIGGRTFIAGDTFTAADLVMASLLHLAHSLKLLERHPRLTEFVRLHASRPAVRRALAGN